MPLVTPPHDKEPRIVTLWKSLQKKTQTRNDNKSKPPLVQDPTEPKSPPSTLPCDDPKKPMRDITNGSSHGSSFNRSIPSGKTRKFGHNSKSLEGTVAITNPFPISGPDISSFYKEGVTNPPCPNVSATFGHCPPENGLMAKYCGAYVDSISPCNAQDYSNFAPNTSQQDVDMPQDDHSLDSDNEEAPMDAVMPSSKDENMSDS